LDGINTIKEELVSIIVPVYNTQEYIYRCVMSIANQTYKNIEIVLVNDGSTDKSQKVCENLKMNDSRITLINKNNSGQGLARNSGLSVVKGKYVIFIDSDDYIQDLDAIKKIVACANENNAEIVSTQFIFDNRVEESNISTGIYKGKNEIKKLMIRILGDIDNKKDTYNVSPCTKLYNVNFLNSNNLLFKSEREYIWEDLIFNFEALSFASKVYVMDYHFYHYCYNSDSTTHKYDSKKFSRVMKMYEFMLRQVEKERLPDEAFRRVNNMFLGNVYTCVKLEALYSSQNGIMHAIKKIQEMIKDARLKKLLFNMENEIMPFSKRVFNFCLKNEISSLIYFLARMQNIKNGNMIN